LHQVSYLLDEVLNLEKVRGGKLGECISTLGKDDILNISQGNVRIIHLSHIEKGLQEGFHSGIFYFI
jgi:hypothetical protein